MTGIYERTAEEKREARESRARLDAAVESHAAHLKATREVRRGPVRQFKWQHCNANYFGGL